jgi:hypothetical protein
MIERTLFARLRRGRARVRRLLQHWRPAPTDEQPAAPNPPRSQSVARTRFWADLRAGQREAEAKAKTRP